MASNNTQTGDATMQVKKIQNADFHNANKLNGRAPRARYGIFKDGVQVGVVIGGTVWDAFDLDCKTRLIGFGCGSLTQLKKALADK